MLWIGHWRDQAAPFRAFVSISSRSSSTPLTNRTPAHTKGSRCAPFSRFWSVSRPLGHAPPSRTGIRSRSSFVISREPLPRHRLSHRRTDRLTRVRDWRADSAHVAIRHRRCLVAQ